MGLHAKDQQILIWKGYSSSSPTNYSSTWSKRPLAKPARRRGAMVTKSRWNISISQLADAFAQSLWLCPTTC